MQEQIAACFIGGVAKLDVAPVTARPIISTAVYETEDGQATLTWSKASFGLSLRVDLLYEEETQTFHLRPLLLWRKRGTKTFRRSLQKNRQLVVDFAWDLRKARFLALGDPQPTGGYYVTISAGNMFFAAGDMEVKAHKKAKNHESATTPGRTILVSRREHVVFSNSSNVYRTRALIEGKEKEISLEISEGDEREAMIRVGIDKKIILQVGQLDWKFRGNEKVEMGGGAAIHISWDVFRWLFERKSGNSGVPEFPSSELGQAVFVFQIEGEKLEEEEGCGLRKVGRRCGVRKVESCSSSSSSSGRSSSILEWASGEEEDAQGSEGLRILVSIWRA